MTDTTTPTDTPEADDVAITGGYVCPHCPAGRHGPDTHARRFAVGDRVTVPAEKCPCCDSAHGITDWTGTIVGTEHPHHAGPADMGVAPPYYVVAMADGQLVYGEDELSR